MACFQVVKSAQCLMPFFRGQQKISRFDLFVIQYGPGQVIGPGDDIDGVAGRVEGAQVVADIHGNDEVRPELASGPDRHGFGPAAVE